VAAGKQRNGLVLAAALVATAYLTGRIYDERPGSSKTVLLAYLLSAVLLLGATLSGGMPKARSKRGKRPVAGPVLTALALFVGFLVANAVLGLIPAVDHAVNDVLARADRGDAFTLWTSTIVAGVAEEVFYRGALFERVPAPVVTATVAHVLCTIPAGNVAVTGAAAVLGIVCGTSRRVSGGWWAPAVTHAAWSLAILWLLPR
jgi:membrane protease YdiL (CAAX protease family)